MIDITPYIFYLFSAVCIGAAIGVVSSKNPVYSVLFLILAFFNAAGLFILLHAELLAMLLVIVYVGAVAVLFLFVVMMLNINMARMKEGFLSYLPSGLLVAMLLLIEFGLIFYYSDLPTRKAIMPILEKTAETNTEAIGNVLYTDYAYLFQISGLILLVAMIGAIVLTHRKREGVRKQDINAQVDRDPKEAVTMVSVKSGEGV